MQSTSPIRGSHRSLMEKNGMLTTSCSTDPLLLAYTFTSPAASKCLNQFIKSPAFSLNNASFELFVCPTAPRGCALHPRLRYTSTYSRHPVRNL